MKHWKVAHDGSVLEIQIAVGRSWYGDKFMVIEEGLGEILSSTK